jgi:hypothetical protein
MSLCLQSGAYIPEATAQVARAAFPKGNLSLPLRDARAMMYAVSVNSFLDTFRPKMRLQQLRHTVAPVSPGQGLCSHADPAARSYGIGAETSAAPGGVLPRDQKF